MNYAEALHYIEEKGRLGIVPGLTQMIELLHRLGNPQDACPALQIAGTNGKGSIFAFVEQCMIEAGYRVGRYISPAVTGYLERYQINKNWMEEERFAALLERVAEAVEAMVADGFTGPTAFEIETAVAFLYFQTEQVDYMLIECGMGGALDATNVIAKPLASVFASISMDHMQFLGDTITEIALQKAGIMREGCACISAFQDVEAAKVLERVSAQKKTPYRKVNPDELLILNMDLTKSTFSYKGIPYEIALLGEHQIYNACTAIEVLQYLKIDTTDIQRGLKSATWPGRMTKVAEHPYIFVDGAHNEAAWRELAKNVKKYFTNKKIIYIIGVLKDKEYEKMIELLAPSMDVAITITPPGPRGLDKETLANLILSKKIPVDMADDAQEAIGKAKKLAGEEAVVMICGSLSFLVDYL